MAVLAAVEYKLSTEVWRVATGRCSKGRRGAWEESRESWENCFIAKGVGVKGSSLKMSARTWMGLQEMSFYSTYTDCVGDGACNCEDVCVYGTISSERRCVIDRQDAFRRP